MFSTEHDHEGTENTGINSNHFNDPTRPKQREIPLPWSAEMGLRKVGIPRELHVSCLPYSALTYWLRLKEFRDKHGRYPSGQPRTDLSDVLPSKEIFTMKGLTQEATWNQKMPHLLFRIQAAMTDPESPLSNPQKEYHYCFDVPLDREVIHGYNTLKAEGRFAAPSLPHPNNWTVTIQSFESDDWIHYASETIRPAHWIFRPCTEDARSIFSQMPLDIKTALELVGPSKQTFDDGRGSLHFDSPSGTLIHLDLPAFRKSLNSFEGGDVTLTLRPDPDTGIYTWPYLFRTSDTDTHACDVLVALSQKVHPATLTIRGLDNVVQTKIEIWGGEDAYRNDRSSGNIETGLSLKDELVGRLVRNPYEFLKEGTNQFSDAEDRHLDFLVLEELDSQGRWGKPARISELIGRHREALDRRRETLERERRR